MLSRVRPMFLQLSNNSVSGIASVEQFSRCDRVSLNSFIATDIFKRFLNQHRLREEKNYLFGDDDDYSSGQSTQMAKSIPRHILKLTRDEKRQFLDSFDQVLSDCDGVLWDLISVFPDSGTALKLLKTEGKITTFVTNNSLRSDRSYLDRFKQAGIEADIDDIIHPTKSIIQYFKAINFDGLIYCLGSNNVKTQLKEAGYKLLELTDCIVGEDFGAFLRHSFDEHPVKAVVMDIDFDLTALKLIKADQYLKKNDCIFICGATDATLKIGKYGTVIGPGPFIKLLETAANKKAIVLGKPGKELGEQILKNNLVRNPKRVLFIGDMLEQDIKFGRDIGCQTLLVLSGGTTREEFMNLTDPAQTPDYYADSLSDFKEFFASLEDDIENSVKR